MPSPVGHALTGAALAWTFGRRPAPGLDAAGGTQRLLAGACIALATAPDLDLLGPYPHRTITHSLLAVAMIAIVTIAVTGKVTGRIGWRIVGLCTAAYGSHLLLDWLAMDDTAPRGIQLLWPFSDRWFISGWDLFRGTARRHVFTLNSLRINLLAVAQETLTLGPMAWLAYRQSRTHRRELGLEDRESGRPPAVNVR